MLAAACLLWDPFDSSESQGEADHVPSSVGVLNNRVPWHPSCAGLGLKAIRKDWQQQGEARSGRTSLLVSALP